MNNSSVKKTKGPSRTEAVVPFIIFCVAVGAYFTLFFDTHLRWGLETGMGAANGAEVDIGSVKSSFIHASLEIRNIQITNPEAPQYNSLQIGNIRFKVLWDGLLRGKVVIDEASVNGIQIKTSRKSPGKVYPKPKPKEEGPSQVDVVAKRTSTKYEGNILGDVATTLGGKSGQDQGQIVVDQLKTNIRAKELEKELNGKQAEWQKKLDSLPKSSEVEKAVQHLKEIKFDNKNPQELIKSVQDAQNTIKDIDGKINAYKSVANDFQNDFNKYSGTIKELDKLAQEDIHDLETRMKIPHLDAKSIASLLFGNEINSKINMVEKYKAMYEKYLPPAKKGEKKEKKEEPIIAQARSKGVTYQFGRPKAYPLFWLKKAKISSKASDEGFSGDVDGTLSNVSSDPKHLGLPIKLEVRGQFPKQEVMGVTAAITADFSGDAPVETFNATIGSFPVLDKRFSDSDDLKFGFNKATGATDITGKLVGSDIDMDIKNKFQKIDYLVKANNSFIQDVLNHVSKDVQVVTLNASITGTLTSPNTGINSNLGEAIGNGFKKQIDVKVKELQDKMKKSIDDAIGPEKNKLTKQFDELKSKYLGGIESKEADMEKQKQAGQSKVNEAQKSAENSTKKQLQQKGQEVLEDLKKKFKF